MVEFTPISASIGGALIGLSACVLLWMNGRIAGISGIAGGAIQATGSERAWRIWFLAGLVAGAGGWAMIHGLAYVPRQGFSTPALIAAGLIVGFGTRLGSGCTSGHGICGVSRLSRRSVLATILFVGSGMVTVYLIRHWLQVDLS